MVWIHGGALLNGANFFSNYGPNEFMKKDVILVSINYRLGAFGFLTLGDENVPGNMGLRDQNLAMQWVNQNIKQFGGDPDTVTIFGESAGALSVAYQIISPLSQGEICNLFELFAVHYNDCIIVLLVYVWLMLF